MNPYEQSPFFTNARLTELWQMVEALLKLASPSLLIFVAIALVGMLIMIVIKTFKKSDDDDNDDEYEIKHY